MANSVGGDESNRTAWMVTQGEYEDYTVLMVIQESKAVAEQWATDYNAAVPWSFEWTKARVEEVDFTPTGLRPRPPGHQPTVIDADQPLVIDGN